MATRRLPARDVRLQVIQVVVVMTLLVDIISVASLYVPNTIGYPIEASIGKRQDYEDDDDEMDSNASAPYQNQDDTAGQQSDGYEEAEPDGPYGETPREEEGQADLEKFFDDHLGASEREGMDKENLPSNIVEQLSLPSQQVFSRRPPSILSYYNSPILAEPMVGRASGSIASYTRNVPTNTVKMRYLKLPDNRVIIVHHEERDTIEPGRDERAGSNVDRQGDTAMGSSSEAKAPASGLRRSDFGDRIRSAKNDDDERVYVTRAIGKPFKIDDLGGYDPEQDFQDAERDLADDQRETQTSSRGNRKSGSAPELNFNDGETDAMFNDASETDEITFAQDDPYQTDLEAEMRSQAFDKPTPAGTGAPFKQAPEVRVSPRRSSPGAQPDEAEGGWIDDGVDEMDIPSQSHQDKVLDKAARQQEAAAAVGDKVYDDRHQVGEEGRQTNQNQNQNQDASAAETANDLQEQQAGDENPHQEDQDQQADVENKRMPNADYLKNLTDEPEDYEENEGL